MNAKASPSILIHHSDTSTNSARYKYWIYHIYQALAKVRSWRTEYSSRRGNEPDNFCHPSNCDARHYDGTWLQRKRWLVTSFIHLSALVKNASYLSDGFKWASPTLYPLCCCASSIFKYFCATLYHFSPWLICHAFARCLLFFKTDTNEYLLQVVMCV